MQAADIALAFGMPPEEAMAYLQSKGLRPSKGWRELWQAAHARAFTVAQSAGYDVLADIKQALLDAMAEGKTLEVFLKELTPTLQAKGWWGKKVDPNSADQETGEIKPVQLGSPRRLRLIYEQNLQTAYMAGRYQTMVASVETHPFWEYVAVMDSRTRPSHAALNGRIFRYDDPAVALVYPPNGWRCRCRMVPLSEGRLAGRRVDTGAGYISTYSKSYADGSVTAIRGIKLPNMDKPFIPDAGWDYNPAVQFDKVAR